jgi:hypothetical protein
VEDVWGGRGDSGILVRIKGVNGRAEPRVAHSRGRWWQKVGDGRERWSLGRRLALGSGGSLALAPRSA